MRGKLLAAMFLTLVVTAVAGDGVEQAIRGQYDRWSKAYAANDTATLLSILAPDFELVNAKGKVTSRAAYKRSLLGRPAGTETVDYRTNVLRLQRRGNRYLVWTEEIVKRGQETHRHRYVDTWSKLKSKWLLSRSKTLSED
jgi:hypothetical protein